MRIVRAGPSDLDQLEPMRLALWPDSAIADLKALAHKLTGPHPTYLVLLALSKADDPIAFAEVALRTDYVNGCDTSPVAFLEGIYVDPVHRRSGLARALVEEAINWGRERGALEFASDVLIDNEESHAFHQAIGFEETDRVVYFRKSIGGTATP